MSNYYAQLDANNVVHSITELHSQETSTNLISVPFLDTTLIGKTYDTISNTFNYTLDQTKKNKIANLQQSYFASFTTFTSSALGVQKTYPIDGEAQTNLEQLERRLIADTNKNSFYFKTIEDGTLVNHTRTQFLQLMADAETFKVNQTTHYDSLVSQVNAATTVDAVNAIIW